jgi:hypothetical protein
MRKITSILNIIIITCFVQIASANDNTVQTHELNIVGGASCFIDHTIKYPNGAEQRCNEAAQIINQISNSNITVRATCRALVSDSDRAICGVTRSSNFNSNPVVYLLETNVSITVRSTLE